MGARRPGQVDGWLPAASLELKDDDLADIAAPSTPLASAPEPHHLLFLPLLAAGEPDRRRLAGFRRRRCGACAAGASQRHS